MLIRTTKMPNAGSCTAQPGVLIGIEHPSAALASAAQTTLNLSQPPKSVLVGIPAGVVGASAYEDAIQATSMAAAKLVSLQLAKASGVPAVEQGVRVFWLGVKVCKLYENWNDPERNLPALLIDTASASLSALNIGFDIGGVESEFLGSSASQQDVGMVFTTAKALAEGEDVSMVILNEKFGSTAMGSVLNAVSPLINAAISDDPDYAGVQFKPLPQFGLPK